MPEIRTVKEHIAWSYANLAAAHSAVSAGAERYGRVNYMIRARLNKGLVSGTMSMGSLLDDEKVKYKYPHSCCYCGATEQLYLELPFDIMAIPYKLPDPSELVLWVQPK